VFSISRISDLKVDVHRKNSSDSNEESNCRLDQILIVDEVNSQNVSEEKSESLSNYVRTF